MKTDYTIGERPNAQWTTRQLKKYIRNVTKIVNVEYEEFEKTYGDYTTHRAWNPLNKMVARLQEIAGTKPKKQKVGLGLTYKHKNELLEQAQALWNYQEEDIYTPGGERRARRREIKRYMEYIGVEPPKNIDDIDEDKFDYWEARYQKESLDIEFQRQQEYEYNENTEDWNESYEERAERMRKSIGEDAYFMAKEEDRKKFDSFLENHDIDITFDEWREMVNFSGGVGNFITQELSSETIVEMVKSRTPEGRHNLDVVYNEAVAQVEADVNTGKAKAVTPQRIVDKMAEIARRYRQEV